MKVSRKNNLTISYSTLNNTIILTRKGSIIGHIASSLDNDWRFPKVDCNNRQAIDYIKNVRTIYPDARLVKLWIK